jgi:hypothetical protein
MKDDKRFNNNATFMSVISVEIIKEEGEILEKLSKSEEIQAFVSDVLGLDPKNSDPEVIASNVMVYFSCLKDKREMSKLLEIPFKFSYYGRNTYTEDVYTNNGHISYDLENDGSIISSSISDDENLDEDKFSLVLRMFYFMN